MCGSNTEKKKMLTSLDKNDHHGKQHTLNVFDTTTMRSPRTKKRRKNAATGKKEKKNGFITNQRREGKKKYFFCLKMHTPEHL